MSVENFVCLLLLMFIGDGETQWDVLVVEFDEGVCDEGNKKDTLLKNKYFVFCKKIGDLNRGVMLFFLF